MTFTASPLQQLLLKTNHSSPPFWSLLLAEEVDTLICCTNTHTHTHAVWTCGAASGGTARRSDSAVCCAGLQISALSVGRHQSFRILPGESHERTPSVGGAMLPSMVTRVSQRMSVPVDVAQGQVCWLLLLLLLQDPRICV